MTEIKKAKEMENSNWKLGAVLVILSILTYLANYFDVLAVPAIVVSVSLSVFIGCVAMVQTFCYIDNESFNDNPGTFWFIYSSVNGVIMVCVIYALGMHMINEQLSLALLYGISPTLIPSIGVFLGDCGRIIVGRPSVIWGASTNYFLDNLCGGYILPHFWYKILV